MELNLYLKLKEVAEKNKKRTVLIYKNKKIRYRELLKSIDSLSYILKTKGINNGDRVAILLRNSPEFVISVFACFKIGAIAVPINIFLTPTEIIYILNDSRSKILISSSEFKDKFQQIKEETNNIKEIIDICEKNLDLDSKINKDVSTNEIASILYTSGTTGHPKGAMLTHRNFISNAESCLKIIKLTKKDRAISFLPLFHSFSFTTTLLIPLFTGASTFLMPHIIKGPKFLKLIFFKKITLFIGIPAVYKMLIKVPKLLGKIAFIRIKYFVSGADTLGEKLHIEFEKKFKKTFIEGYGLTEAAPVVTLNPPEKSMPGTIGLPIPGVELKIVDGEGKEVKNGEIGEIIVKGENVMKGYFGMEEATKKTIKDGWLYTGDLAKIEKNGYIKIVDRKKDMFVAKGLNVYPREIENVIKDIPEIEEVAVIGEKIKSTETEIPIAFVKTKKEVSKQEIISYCRRRLANYKIPRKIIFIEEFPKTSTGKISKKDLRTFLT